MHSEQTHECPQSPKQHRLEEMVRAVVSGAFADHDWEKDTKMVDWCVGVSKQLLAAIDAQRNSDG